MLSKKMAVSLTSLLTILAFAFMVSPAAMAQTLSVEVKKQTPKNVYYKLSSDSTAVDTAEIPINLNVEFSHSIATGNIPAASLTVVAFDKNGSVVASGNTPTVADVPQTGGTDPYADRSGKKRQIRVALTPTQETAGSSPDAKKGMVEKIVVTIANLATADPSVAFNVDTNDDDVLDAAHFPRFSHTITVNQPYTAASGTAAGDRPQVVSIQRLRPGSQTVVAAFQEAEVTGAFDVRIVLTEEPHEFAKFASKIKVTNGTKSDFVVGEPFAWFGGIDASETPPVEREPSAANQPHTVTPHPIEGMYMHSGMGVLAGVPAGVTSGDYASFVPLPSKDDNDDRVDMYYQCRVTITPHRRATEVKVSVESFRDAGGDDPLKHFYYPSKLDEKPNGREQLLLKVNIEKFDLKDGLRVYLPHKEKAKITYANSTPGHYILTRLKTGSGINYFHHEDTAVPDRENMSKEQTPSQLLYNVRQTSAETPDAREVTADAPQENLPNLERFLHNNGTIHLVSYHKDSKAGDAYISEVMWGTDASLANPADSNWVEIRNGTTKAIAIGEQEWALWFYEAHETPPSGADPYPANSAYEGPVGQKGTLIDVISTKDSTTGLSWSITGKGQSGRSNIDKARADAQVIAGTIPLISMYRMMDATDMTKPADGTKAANWVMSVAPSVNIHEDYEHAIVATPGAAPFDTPDSLKEAKDKEEAKTKADAAKGTYPKQGQGRVYISEIMFAGGGTLPQWIEIANGDRSTEFNLSGWTLTVNNAVADTDVSVGASAKFTIPDGTTIDASAQNDTPSTILVVTERGRNSFDSLPGTMGRDQIINLATANEIDLITAGVLTGKYTLLSDTAFQIILAPPVPKATKAPAGETAAAKATRTANEKKEAALRKAATDMVGNLGKDGAAAWALPTNEEGGRSSIIRQHVQVVRGPAAPEDGMMENNWRLASETSFAQVTHIRASSYYGAANDVGTPGFRAGGALPVELSHFRPARDKATGQVVITWATQSELNNAGFFIKRSQQRNGEFKIINATMIAGAGTTSEKQFYTYTDTTAQPNVVYYYQIEDVSLDGNRQTLTRGIRLKGHIGAAGKATTLWGELKSSNE